MSAASEILKHVMDENPKALMDTFNQVVLDKISSRLEEKRVEVTKNVYERTTASEEELEDDDLANNYGDPKKITRGDVIAGAIHKAKKRKRKGHSK